MEECREEHMHESLAENDDSYIEIELDSCAVTVTPTCGSSEEEDDNVVDDHKWKQERSEEYEELRISISSTIPLPDDAPQCVVDFCHETETSVGPSASSGGPPLATETSSSSSSSSAEYSPINIHDSGLNLTAPSDDDQPRLKFPAFDRLFNFNVFGENRQSGRTLVTMKPTMPFNSCNNVSTSTRKEGSMPTRNGGIMKMLIKFRGIKLRTLISFLVKPPPSQDGKGQKQSNRKYSRTILQCYHQKNMVINPSASGSEEIRSKRGTEAIRRSCKPWDLSNSNYEDSFGSTRRWTRSVVEIDLGALRGIFGNIGRKTSSSKRKSWSSAMSCDNSPIHEGFSSTTSSDHNSIQAAIAYCKTSFGQTSYFSFR